MPSTPVSGSSLYEIALSSSQPSLVLQLNPATFRSVVASFIDLLTTQRIPAVVWAKLPRGEVWQTELDLYNGLTEISKVIYQFKNYRDESGRDESGRDDSHDEAVMVSTTIAPEQPMSNSGDAASIRTEGSIVSIQLAPESPLRREYFVLVWSAQFQGMVLAHRPRSTSVVKAATSSNETEAGPTAEDGQERRQYLLTLCSFDPGLIRRILVGLGQAASASRVLETPAIADIASPDELVAHWQGVVAEMASAPPNLGILGQLFTLQLQRQDELWQRYSNYRKQAETVETLQLQNEDLTNSIRLKDEFLNNVGQELRTPLTTIKTALTLLNSPTIKQPQRQRYMDLITKECDRQSSLITSLLDLVQLEQVVEQSNLQPIRLSDVVPGVVSTFQPVAEEKGVKLAYTVPEDLPVVSCVGNWLKQIVINLLNNGIKFTPRGGQVWVRAKQQGDYVQLEFRDTGIGIAPNEVPKIFERFYRVRQSVEESSGAGLGLTIVQQLLIHCGGSISVKSRLGEGSIFNVLLPIHKSPNDSSTSLNDS